MEHERKLRKIGNSLGVGLPSEIVKDLNLKEGDTVFIKETDGDIIIRDSSRKDVDDQFKMKVIKIIDEYFKDKESK